MGDTQHSFIQGGSTLDPSPYPLYTIFDRKGTPLIYHLLIKLMVPLSHTQLRTCIPFNCWKYIAF